MLIVYVVTILVVVFNNITDLIATFGRRGLDLNLVVSIVVTLVSFGIYTLTIILNRKRVGW